MHKYITCVLLAVLFGGLLTLHAQSQPAMTPMSCRFEGKILKVLPLTRNDKASVCSKYPCRARVRIIQAFGCGSSVTQRLDKGAIIDIEFAYTLHNTTRLFPGMKTQYPGLKRGSRFIANAEQGMKPGDRPYFTIYAYEVR